MELGIFVIMRIRKSYDNISFIPDVVHLATQKA